VWLHPKPLIWKQHVPSKLGEYLPDYMASYCRGYIICWKYIKLWGFSLYSFGFPAEEFWRKLNNIIITTKTANLLPIKSLNNTYIRPRPLQSRSFPVDHPSVIPTMDVRYRKRRYITPQIIKYIPWLPWETTQNK
jgi:hypothetical protein